MENASKALIIAGAILLSILLISLGIFVFTQAQDTMNSINLNEQEIMAFNNKFLSYEGTKRGSQINQLAQLVLSNNQSANNEGATEKIITMTYPNANGETVTLNAGSTTAPKANTGGTYNVAFTYVNSLINTITVTQ